jgi:hypothetical protein
MSPFCLGTGNRGEPPAADRAERITSEILPSWRTLEVKYDAGRDAQVVLILRAVARFVEVGEKIVHLDRAEREMMRQVRVDAATERIAKELLEVEKVRPLLPAMCATPNSTWPYGVKWEG